MSSNQRTGWEWFRERCCSKLNQLEQKGRLRDLQPPWAPGGLIDLTSNDYLSLTSDAQFQSRLHRHTEAQPIGSSSSRLLAYDHEVFLNLEQRFASFKGSEASVFFGSGFSANIALIHSLSHSGAHLIYDELSHASIVDGVRSSPLPRHAKSRFRHGDLKDLERRLESCGESTPVVITESLYSMDGDRAELRRLQELVENHGGILIVDEAHSLGVAGEHGQGEIHAQGLNPATTISINPCGKGFGASGAFVCGPSWLQKYIVNTARPFIYSTAPSPKLAAALCFILDEMPELEPRRKRLQKISKELTQAAKTIGLETFGCSAHILPLYTGNEASALNARQLFAEKGFATAAIRPPTVAENSCRLRLSLKSSLSDLDVERLVATFRALKELVHD